MVVFAVNADLTTRASLNLTCMASGSPTPTITWFRNGARLSLGQRITVNANDTLHIANITENPDAAQMGTRYHCTVMNKFGTIRSRTANISYACELKEKRGEKWAEEQSTLENNMTCVALLCFRFWWFYRPKWGSNCQCHNC